MTDFIFGAIDEGLLVKRFFSMGEVAKILKIPKLGRTNLYRLLREKEIINDYNEANNKYIELGYFTSTITNKSYPNSVTTVTHKGLAFLQNLVK